MANVLPSGFPQGFPPDFPPKGGPPRKKGSQLPPQLPPQTSAVSLLPVPGFMTQGGAEGDAFKIMALLLNGFLTPLLITQTARLLLYLKLLDTLHDFAKGGGDVLRSSLYSATLAVHAINLLAKDIILFILNECAKPLPHPVVTIEFVAQSGGKNKSQIQINGIAVDAAILIKYVFSYMFQNIPVPPGGTPLSIPMGDPEPNGLDIYSEGFLGVKIPSDVGDKIQWNVTPGVVAGSIRAKYGNGCIIVGTAAGVIYKKFIPDSKNRFDPENADNRIGNEIFDAICGYLFQLPGNTYDKDTSIVRLVCDAGPKQLGYVATNHPRVKMMLIPQTFADSAGTSVEQLGKLTNDVLFIGSGNSDDTYTSTSNLFTAGTWTFGYRKRRDYNTFNPYGFDFFAKKGGKELKASFYDKPIAKSVDEDPLAPGALPPESSFISELSLPESEGIAAKITSGASAGHMGIAYLLSKNDTKAGLVDWENVAPMISVGDQKIFSTMTLITMGEQYKLLRKKGSPNNLVDIAKSYATSSIDKQPSDSLFFIDIKRGGDYDQVEAAYLASFKYPNVVLVTGDRLCAALAICYGLATVYVGTVGEIRCWKETKVNKWAAPVAVPNFPVKTTPAVPAELEADLELDPQPLAGGGGRRKQRGGGFSSQIELMKYISGQASKFVNSTLSSIGYYREIMKPYIARALCERMIHEIDAVGASGKSYKDLLTVADLITELGKYGYTSHGITIGSDLNTTKGQIKTFKNTIVVNEADIKKIAIKCDGTVSADTQDELFDRFKPWWDTLFENRGAELPLYVEWIHEVMSLNIGAAAADSLLFKAIAEMRIEISKLSNPWIIRWIYTLTFAFINDILDESIFKGTSIVSQLILPIDDGNAEATPPVVSSFRKGKLTKSIILDSRNFSTLIYIITTIIQDGLHISSSLATDLAEFEEGPAARPKVYIPHEDMKGIRETYEAENWHWEKENVNGKIKYRWKGPQTTFYSPSNKYDSFIVLRDRLYPTNTYLKEKGVASIDLSTYYIQGDTHEDKIVPPGATAGGGTRKLRRSYRDKTYRKRKGGRESKRGSHPSQKSRFQRTRRR